ncbi:KRAB-A domain-containing protein 2-like isoform X2 [Littorina saxatilis]|uniref:KRAB-A domain-containing protein 2-like isoform X2 n=1 Tax=Littorina saxatilis TaxID=31220 RepID=UPI0038B6654B
MDTCVSREEFDAFCEKQYPPDAAMKTMRRDKIGRIARFLKGEEAPPLGSWRYRIVEKGYTLASFPKHGLKEVLCLKGADLSGRCELGMFGEWRKVVPVEEFYDVLLDAHVQIQNHGGYKNLLKALEVNYRGIPREAASTFVSLCKVCHSNTRQRQRTAKATAASRERVVKLPCVTRDFNRRCQIDLLDMTQNPDGEYTHISLYMDHWTKFMTLFPMTGCSPEHVAYGLASSVYPYYGPPQFLHSPDGKEFAEEVIRLSLEKWKGGEKTVLPQAKPGLMHLGEIVEARRDTLIAMINSRAVEENVEGPIPWAGWLGKIMFDINNQVSNTTRKSPYSRVFEHAGAGSDQAETSEGISDYAMKGPKGKVMTALRVKATKRTHKQPDDANAGVVITSYRSPRPVGATKLPRTTVYVEKPTT